MSAPDLVVGKRYWWDNGLFWTVLELRNVYKNGRVRLIETAKDGGGNWFEVKTPPDDLYGPTDAAIGAKQRKHPALTDAGAA